jgi:hypothetical protein
MAAKAARAQRTQQLLPTNESASLWNWTLSPGPSVRPAVRGPPHLPPRTHAPRPGWAGWLEAEVDVLHRALLKYGVGNWSAIVDSGCLPGKTPAQLNNQTQRMLGQQSTAGT